MKNRTIPKHPIRVPVGKSSILHKSDQDYSREENKKALEKALEESTEVNDLEPKVEE